MTGRHRDQMGNTTGGLDGEVTRRRFLHNASLIGLGAALGPAILGALSACSSTPSAREVRMGITFGNQILWRYLAQKRDDLLKPLGYDVTFINYQDDSQLVEDFVNGKIDVCAAILTVLPTLSAAADVQLFLPIAWMKWGFPIVVPQSSSVSSVADLQGKKVAYYGPNHPSTVFWQSLVRENYGFDLQGKAVMVGYNQLPAATLVEAMGTGQADAAIVESNALSQALPKGTYRQIADLRTEWGKISKTDRLLVYGGYAARTGWVSANKKFVEDLVRLNYEALKSYKSGKGRVIDPAVSYAGENAPPMTAESGAYVAEYLGYDDVHPDRVYVSKADVDDYKVIFSLLAKAGYLKSAPQDVDKMFHVSGNRPQ